MSTVIGACRGQPAPIARYVVHRMGTAACPLCGAFFPLHTDLGRTSDCGHCGTTVAPRPELATAAEAEAGIHARMQHVAAAITRADRHRRLEEAQAQAAVAAAAEKDTRLKEEVLCEKCNKVTECYTYSMQIRSADEGQTIFYTCTICNNQWSLNS